MKPKEPSASTLRRFGMTIEDWRALMAAQDERCAICKRKFTASRPPANDHNHRTGWMRGLLCSPCNSTLGYMHDDAEWFYNAWAYLESPPANDIFEQPRLHVSTPGGR